MKLDRRELLKLLGLSGASVLLPEALQAQGGRPPRPVLRVAFLTDIHLPLSGQNDTIKQLLRQVQSPGLRVNMIVFGGDNIFAADGGSKEIAQKQLSNWTELIKENIKLPYYSVVGNHDIWASNATGLAGFSTGKQMAIDAFNMPQRYYSVSRAGWRFMMLDSVQPGRMSYFGEIDAEQYTWLSGELAKNHQPTVLVSHIPILSVAPLQNRELPVHGSGFRVPFSRLIKNSRELVELVRINPHVRLSLSGHLHMDDTIQYQHSTYVCGGSVCGAWWKGNYENFTPSYYLVDMFDNGQAFTRRVSAKMGTV